MKLRIALLTSDATEREYSEILNNQDCEIIPFGKPAKHVDGLLYIPTGPDDVPSDLLQVTAKSALSSQETTLAALCPAATDPGPIAPFIPVPSTDVFLQLTRLGVRQRQKSVEMQMRRDVMQSFSGTLNEAEETEANSKLVLYLGDPSPFYMKCAHDFAQKGYRVQAALSERTAFDYLRNEKPIALIVAFENGFQPMELLDHIHGRRDLWNMPIIAFAERETALPDISALVTSLILLGSNDAENALNLISRFSDVMEHSDVSAIASDVSVKDPYSTAFHASFAENYMKRFFELTQKGTLDGVTAILSPFGLNDGADIAPEAIASFSNIMTSQLRSQDMFARLDWKRFLINFTGSNGETAMSALERLQAVLESTRSTGSGPLTFSHTLINAREFSTSSAYWRAISHGTAKRDGSVQSAVA